MTRRSSRLSFITGDRDVENLFTSIGQVKELFTLVDYYHYIKGLEYLICLAFFVGFPVFYRYINQPDESTDDK
jgi:hypothetical protein